MYDAKHIVRLSGWALFCVLIMAGCRADRSSGTPVPSTEETALLLEYLEESGNLINSQYIPSLIDAGSLQTILHGHNTHVIDLRPAASYRKGHIENSVNVRPPDILTHFERVIEPAAFGHIVLACEDAMVSTYVNAVLRLLGHDNVYTLRFGMSSWDMEIAREYWLGALGDHWQGNLVSENNPGGSQGALPAIATGERTGYGILRARAREVLNADRGAINIPVDDVMNDPATFYIVNYWPSVLYERGHLPGAIQYTPKASLHSNARIRTLPTGQPIITYCFTGQHSGYVTAFLRLLGYDAYNLPYGANSFIHGTMREEQGGMRTFTEESVHHYPLSGGAGETTPELPSDETEDRDPAIGGC